MSKVLKKPHKICVRDRVSGFNAWNCPFIAWCFTGLFQRFRVCMHKLSMVIVLVVLLDNSHLSKELFRMVSFIVKTENSNEFYFFFPLQVRTLFFYLNYCFLYRSEMHVCLQVYRYKIMYLYTQISMLI